MQAEKRKKAGVSAFVKSRQFDDLLAELKNTSVGTLNDDINYIENISTTILDNSDVNSISLVKLLKQMKDDVFALQNQRGICPQSLIL